MQPITKPQNPCLHAKTAFIDSLPIDFFEKYSRSQIRHVLTSEKYDPTELELIKQEPYSDASSMFCNQSDSDIQNIAEKDSITAGEPEEILIHKTMFLNEYDLKLKN